MLGESFKYVAPVAGAMKYSVEDTSLALGLAKKIKNKKIIGSKFAMSTIAYNGWFVTTDSFLVRVAECWDQLISMAKNIISRYAKQKSYAMEKYYKKWRKLNYA